MSWSTLIRRSLRFYWRTHLGVLGAAGICTAVLVGALLVGDSVRESLRGLARARLGQVTMALHSPNRYQRTELADQLGRALSVPAAPVLRLRGILKRGAARVNQVVVLGVDRRFWALGPEGSAGGDGVALNRGLADQLGVTTGDELLLRVERPSVLSSDLPLSADRKRTVALRLTVGRIVGPRTFGRFSLRADQVPPFNLFVPLTVLQRRVGMAGRSNMILLGGTVTPVAAADALAQHWRLADGGLTLRDVPNLPSAELVTERIFLEPAVVSAVTRAVPQARGLLSYLANEIRVGSRRCPYSVVTATGEGPVDQIRINRWLAQDLQATPGKKLTLTYFTYRSARQLTEHSHEFTIGGVQPLTGEQADPTLMPEVPGLSDAEDLASWDAPIPIDTSKIRAKDERYWDDHRGTPKAFITLAAGQQLWGNRFGTLTALRFPPSQKSAVRDAIPPPAVGLFFRPVGLLAHQASHQGLDFGPLFLGLSFFLIAAALILTALLFVFGIEQRRSELGLLLALGVGPARVRRLWLAEGGTIAFLGALIGTAAGLGYGWLILRGLTTVWQGAVAGSAVVYTITPTTLAVGPLAGTFVALGAIWLVLRKEGRAPARSLLADEPEVSASAATRARLSAAGAVLMLATGLVLPLVAGDKQVELFFTAGGLLLVGTLLASHALLSRLARGHGSGRLTLGGVALRSATRRRGRSLAVISLLACASFLIIAVGANRKRVQENASTKSSGTGGFALYGETSVGISRDLGTPDGREAYGLDRGGALDVVQLRLREGDDASCLNLNRPQTPRLLGVPSGKLSGRFSFVATDHPTQTPWALLEEQDAGALPAIADKTTLMWALKKAVGDTMTLTNGQGKPITIRFVGALDASILQGAVLISEANFLRSFPAAQGYRGFLIEDVSARESLASSAPLRDAGLDLFSSTQRLADFNVVENTYLTIFQALGGLGLLLGTAGLGLVVSRNVLERRTELAQLRAIGFARHALQRMVLAEHVGLLLIGVASGVFSALVAVLPAVRSAQDVPFTSLAVTMAAVTLSGLLWTWLATRAALRGDLLCSLRSE